MTRNITLKFSFVIAALLIAFSVTKVKAFPDYLKQYAADLFSRPELRANCTTCHVNAQGGGERNAFGKAFEAAGFRITDELRQQFPDRFLLPGAQQTPPVSFVPGSESQAVVEINGKKFLIDARARTISEVVENSPTVAATTPKAAPEMAKAQPEEARVYQPMDVRLINLPTAKPIPKGSLWTDFTHRFPFKEYGPTEPAGLFGLDGFAVPAFGFVYGLTDRIHIGAYRAPAVVGAPIQLSVGASLLDENREHPFTAMVHVGVEGRDNFQRSFTPSIDLTLARSITSKAQLYLVPTISFSNRPFGSPEQNLPGEHTFALGAGGAFNIRPTVALLAEANMRVNKKGRFDSTRPAFGFGIEKVSVTGRHAFSLVFTNGAGTTMSQRSGTRASLLGPFAEESFQGLTIGFNLSRRLF
jgi:hypothetical protein